jgi:hypothetical protein
MASKVVVEEVVEEVATSEEVVVVEEVVEEVDDVATETKEVVNKDGFAAGKEVSQEDYFKFIAKQNNA